MSETIERAIQGRKKLRYSCRSSDLTDRSVQTSSLLPYAAYVANRSLFLLVSAVW